jgi:hypothetical protein
MWACLSSVPEVAALLGVGFREEVLHQAAPDIVPHAVAARVEIESKIKAKLRAVHHTLHSG